MTIGRGDASGSGGKDACLQLEWEGRAGRTYVVEVLEAGQAEWATWKRIAAGEVTGILSVADLPAQPYRFYRVREVREPAGDSTPELADAASLEAQLTMTTGPNAAATTRGVGPEKRRRLALMGGSSVGDPGDLVSASIETNGWVLRLQFRGMPTNGLWDFGFDTNRMPASTNRLVLQVQHPGFGPDCLPTLISQSLVGTRQLRLPYPDQSKNDVITNAAGGCVARIALSDFVFANSQGLRLTLLSGLYRGGGATNAAVADFSVVNESTLVHPRTVAKWTWPPYWRITNDTYQLRMVAFHRSAMNFQPVRAVKFWSVASDGTSNAPVVVTNLTIDPGMNDAVPVQEYVVTLPATNFASGVWVTNHFAVYPWIGDESSVISTDNRKEAWNTDRAGISPYYMPYPLLCDRSNSYGATLAVVANNGSDAAGRVIRGAQFNAGLPPPAFLTVDGAASAIRKTNGLWFGAARTNTGAATILMREGNYAWTGGTSSRGLVPETWVTVDAYPGAAWTNVVFTNRNSGLGSVSGAGGMDRVRNVTFRTTTGGTFRNQHLLWLDHCYLDCAEPNALYSPTNVFLTSCTLVTNGTAGLNYVSPAPTTYSLIRGCRLAPMSRYTVQLHTFIGNLRDVDDPSSTNTTPTFRQVFGLPPRNSHDVVFAYNKLYYLSTASRASAVEFYRDTNDCTGLVIAGNLLECHRGFGVSGLPVLSVAWGSSSQPTSNRVDNVMIWNNTLVGNRSNLGEDATGSGTHGDGIPNSRWLWSVRNNWFGSANTKHDTEYTPNGGRVHGWPVLYGVGWAGNWDLRLPYDCGWWFLNLGTPGTQPANCLLSRTNVPGFLDFRAFEGSGGSPNNTGGGDYHVRADSPGIGFGTGHAEQQPLAFDLDGVPRYPGGVIGAFEYVPPMLNLSSVVVDEVTWNSARVRWVTDQLADSRVAYSAAGQPEAELGVAETVTNHAVLLTGLSPSTSYTLAVRSMDRLGRLGSSPALSILTSALPQNDPPAALSAVVSLEEDGAADVLLAGVEPEGDPLTYEIEALPQHGRLEGLAPHLRYYPDTNWFGLDSLRFVVSDGQTVSAPAEILLEVAAVNDPPRASDQFLELADDGTVAFSLAVSDPDDALLDFQIVRPPSGGSLTGQAPNLSYQRGDDFTGLDSFDYVVTDGVATRQATVWLRWQNHRPVATPATWETAEDQVLDLALAGEDADADALTFEIVQPPQHGVLLGTPPQVQYLPTADWHGVDHFSFRASDHLTSSVPAEVTLTVLSVNDAPVLAGGQFSLLEDGSVDFDLLASDADGEAIAVTLLQAPAHGALSGAGTHWRYVPATDFFGTDTALFTATDGHVSSVPATVVFVVNGVNDPPVASSQSVQLLEDQSRTIELAGADPEGAALTYVIASQPQHGTLSGQPPLLLYTPSRDWSGIDQFTFRTSDGTATSALASVTLEVAPVNDAPRLTAGRWVTSRGVPVDIHLEVTDPEGDLCAVQILSGPAHGTLSGAGTSWRYEPAVGFSGMDEFLTVASDGATSGDPVTQVVQVNAAQFPGDVVGVAIETNGWQLLVWIGGMSTGGTYEFGFGPDNALSGQEKVRLLMNSPGYDDSGSPTVVVRTNFGTSRLRRPFPEQALADEVVEGGGVRLRLALAEPVHSTDGNLRVSLGSGLYRAGGLASRPAVLTVTNLSQLNYPKVVGNWSWPGWRVMTGDVLDLRVVAFHASAQDGAPVRSVKFWVTDQHGNSVTQWTTRPLVDASLGDALPVPEYVGMIDSTGLRSGDLWTCNFVAFPWWGDTNAVLDTSTSGIVGPSPLPGPITHVSGRPGGYGVTRCFVAVDGVDSTGVAARESYWATNSTPRPFRTAGAALKAIAATNAIAYGRNDFGAGEIYLRPGDHAWMGATLTLPRGPAVPCLITAAPGASRDEVRIVAQSVDQRGTEDEDMFIFRNVTFDTASSTMFYRAKYLWLDQVQVLNATGSSFFQSGTTVTSPVNCWYVTRSVISNLTQGLRPYANQVCSLPLVRGNFITGSCRELQVWTALGNYRGASSIPRFSVFDELTSQVAPRGNPILFNNAFYGLRDAIVSPSMGGNRGVTNGAVVVQNVFEQCSTNTASTGYGLFSVAGLNYTNVMIWNNVLVGTKTFLGYNEVGSSAWWRSQWSVYNNIFDDYNQKGDTFTGSGGGSGSRLGNWPLAWGVGFQGNAMLETTGVGAPGSFLNEFHGINSWGSINKSPSMYAGWADRRSYDGLTAGAGGGNYRISPTSPLRTRNPSRWVVSHDLEGRPRYSGGVIGAYEIDPGPLSLSEVSIRDLTTNGAQFSWTSSRLATARVDFGTTESLGATIGDASESGPHTLRISGLTAGTVYFARAVSRDGWGHEAISGMLSFMTVPLPSNQAPQAQAQTVTTAEDTAVVVMLAGTDADGDALTYEVVDPPLHGVLSGTAPGVTYTPELNYHGPDAFTFRVGDGMTKSLVTSVAITVSAENDAPQAQAQTVTTAEDTAVAVMLAGTDADGDALTYEVVDPPLHGVLSGTAPGVTYTPEANYHGPDAFTFRVSDGSTTSPTASVTITVSAENDAPQAQAQTVTTAEDTAVAVMLAGTDADGDALTCEVVDPPLHGVLSGTAPGVTYTPEANYHGLDAFTFRVGDGSTTSPTASVTITVSAENDAPQAQAQTVTTAEDTAVAVMLAGTDVDGGALTYEVVDPPLHGVLSGTAPGVTYTPEANYHGPDAFTFRVSDGTTSSPTASVTITVSAENDAPQAQAQTVTTAEDTAVVVMLAGTDADGDALTYEVVDPPLHGVLSGTAPGVTYTPEANYHGPDAFTFRVSDGMTTSPVASVTITVSAENDAPQAQAQTVTTAEDTAVAVMLAGTDADGDTLTYEVVDSPLHGVLSGTGPGVTYTPEANYHGPDEFTFRVSDGSTTSPTASVTITVSAENDAPQAQAQTVTTAEDTAVAVMLAGTDADGDALTYEVVDSPLHGVLSGTAPGVTYTPEANYHGLDAFTFRVGDGSTTSPTASVTITVSAENDAPQAQAQTVTTAEDTAVAVMLAGTDADGDVLTYEVVDSPLHGVLSGTAPGVTYTPEANYHGPDAFTFRVSDGSTTSPVASVTITVQSP